MQQKTNNSFSLIPSSSNDLTYAESWSLYNKNSNLTLRQKRMDEEVDIQLHAIMGKAYITGVGLGYIEDLYKNFGLRFVDTADAIWEARAGQRDKDIQEVIDFFCIRIIKEAGVSMTEATRSGVQAIVREIAREIYIPEIRQQKTIWQRLRGDND